MKAGRTPPFKCEISHFKELRNYAENNAYEKRRRRKEEIK